MNKYLLVLLTMSVFLSELILIINKNIGFLLYIILITGVLIVLSKSESLDDRGKLISVFLILPVLRIASLFLEFSFFWKTAIFYYLLFFLVIFYSFKFKINPGYSKKGLILLPLVILLSVSLGYLGYKFFSIETIEKNIEILSLIPIIAFSEEMLFRSLIQNLIEKNNGIVSSILFTSLLYAIFSLSYSIYFIAFIFIINIIMSLIYSFTKNIFLTITASIIIHIFLFVLPQF